MTHAADQLATHTATHQAPTHQVLAHDVPAPDPLTDPMPDLWEWAAFIYHEITSSWDTPRVMGDNGWYPRRRHRLLRDWVRHLEILVRRILIAAALAITLPPPRAHASPRTPPNVPQRHGAASPILSAIEMARRLPPNPRLSQNWPTRFSIFPAQRTTSRRRIHRRREPTARELHSEFETHAVCARSIALRLESLRRIIAEPHIAARRVVRTLARIKARNLTANAPRIPFLAPWIFAVRNGCPGSRLIDDPMRIAQPLAEEAYDRWRDSS